MDTKQTTSLDMSELTPERVIDIQMFKEVLMDLPPFCFDPSSLLKMNDKAALQLFQPSNMREFLDLEYYEYLFLLAVVFPCYIPFGIVNEENAYKFLHYSLKL